MARQHQHGSTSARGPRSEECGPPTESSRSTLTGERWPAHHQRSRLSRPAAAGTGGQYTPVSPAQPDLAARCALADATASGVSWKGGRCGETTHTEGYARLRNTEGCELGVDIVRFLGRNIRRPWVRATRLSRPAAAAVTGGRYTPVSPAQPDLAARGALADATSSGVSWKWWTLRRDDAYRGVRAFTKHRGVRTWR